MSGTPDRPAPGPRVDARRTITVAPADCATQWGNDDLEVLSTPAILGHMERLCVTAVAPHLRSGQMTVGVSVEMRHLAPTPVGEKVEFHITTALTGRRFTVTFTAADSAGRVLATGTHDRAIVDEAAFRARIGGPAS
ncbi:thioesterase family protein [Actinomadura kijaniata]|uniref:thioesterase family protein n=1 Tax=Actinomadura kijaniata TaxID=46161 RepID=UPI000A0480A6|nr:hotdog domain-containing protein [Actinomadura kijaniata]